MNDAFGYWLIGIGFAIGFAVITWARFQPWFTLNPK